MNTTQKARIAIRKHVLLAALLLVGLISLVILGLRVIQLEQENAEQRAFLVARTAEIATYTRLTCAKTPIVQTASTTTEHTLASDGMVRSYRVHTPSSYDPSIRLPVVLSFDGIDGSGAQMQSYSGLDQLPAIVVYPDSLPSVQGFTAWQGAPYSQPGVDDISFVKAILGDVATNYCTDPAKVYAVGMSNGGAFASLVGCELGDSIRAVASVSGAYYTSCQSKTRTASLLVLHSIDDNRVPFGGELARGLPKVPEWVQQQSQLHGCTAAQPSRSENGTVHYGWSGCKDNSKVSFVVLGGQVHGWLTVPTSASGKPVSTAEYIWQFFESSAQL